MELTGKNDIYIHYILVYIFYIYIFPIGRNQVMVGVVPINVHHASSESSKSVYPIAIANCAENR